MIGKKFCKWTIIKEVDIRAANKAKQYECVCECGFVKIVTGTSLRFGSTTQCQACHNRENSKKNSERSHCGTPTYRLWKAILQRCRNEKNISYKYYGGRGITVCERWKKFENFLMDIGPRPYGLQIDRIDNNKGYYPGNCRWVTPKVNSHNRRNSINNRPINKVFSGKAETSGLQLPEISAQ